jgi:5-methylcytosine-specific restriction endonuclease McrA
MVDASWLMPRRCLCEPIEEIREAAELLSDAVDFHLAGNREACSQLIKQADMPVIAAWTESMWGHKTQEVHRYRDVPGLPPILPRNPRVDKRKPLAAVREQLWERDGFHCRYCGIPVIEKKTRDAMAAVYTEVRWGGSNSSQHAAFQCMWLQYDHVLPHCRGGDNSLENIVITCAPCNFGKLEKTVQDLGLLDPRERSPESSSWDGLSRFM